MKTPVEQEYWDDLYQERKLVYEEDGVLFKELFEKYLTPGGECFEVGCFPGNFLIYLGRRFGYRVSGIDATPQVETRMRDYLEGNGVEVGELFRGNFLEFVAPKPYEVVCSFGFVEHFYNFEEIIKLHIKLTKESGTLILSCPNFRGLQYWLHRAFDSVNLRRHVLEAMDLDRWRRVLEANGMEVVHQGYYRTADFWVEAEPRSPIARASTARIRRLFQAVDRRLSWPNPMTSPYMISISKKKETATKATDNGR